MDDVERRRKKWSRKKNDETPLDQYEPQQKESSDENTPENNTIFLFSWENSEKMYLKFYCSSQCGAQKKKNLGDEKSRISCRGD